jgi:hypothetical protein
MHLFFLNAKNTTGSQVYTFIPMVAYWFRKGSSKLTTTKVDFD